MNDLSPGEALHLAGLDHGRPRVLRVEYHGPARTPPLVTVRRAIGIWYEYTDVPPEYLFKSEEDALACARGMRE